MREGLKSVMILACSLCLGATAWAENVIRLEKEVFVDMPVEVPTEVTFYLYDRNDSEWPRVTQTLDADQWWTETDDGVMAGGYMWGSFIFKADCPDANQITPYSEIWVDLEFSGFLWGERTSHYAALLESSKPSRLCLEDAYGQWDIEGGDNLQFIDDGTVALIVNDQGSVGVGTTSPQTKLHLYKPNKQTGDKNRIRLEDWNGYWEIEGGDNFHLFDDGEVKFILNKNGRVGIGITSPRGTLDVNGVIVQRVSDWYAEPNFAPESIESHFAEMVTANRLKALPERVTDNAGNDVVDTSAYLKGLQQELEKAHLYIATLNEVLQFQQEKIDALTERVAALEDEGDL